MSSSRTVSYEFTAKQSLTAAFTETQRTVAGAADQMNTFSQRVSATASESDKLKVSVRETGNEFTRMRDAANAATAQNKTAFESQRNELRLVAEQARTTAAQIRAEQAANRPQGGGGGLGFGDIVGGSFLGNVAAQGLQQVQQLAGDMLGLGKSSLELAGNLEMSRAAFTSLLGSAQAADTELKALRAFSDKAPLFDTTNTQHFAQMLAGAGEDARNLVPDLKAIGAVVAGTGGGTQQLQEVALAYTQVLSQQKLAGQEALQFGNANVPIWRIISEYMGVTTAEARQLSQEGKITADVFQQAFSAYAVNHFNDALSQAGDTIQGLGAQIQSGWQNALTEFGTGLATGIKPTLRDIAATLQDPRTLETIRAWGVEAGKFAGQLWDGAKAVASWVGLELPQIPAAPDYSALKVSTDGVQSNLKQTITYQTDFTRQITTAKNEVQRLRDAQTESSTASQNAANAIRDAQTLTDREYDRQLNSLKDAGTQMERNFQIAKQQRDLEQARTQLADDTRLAGDIFSSAGQAARERMKEDQKRVQDQQEQMAQDTAKFENRQAQTSVERAKQASDQRAQDQITALERSRQAEEQATAARIRDLDATAKNYQTLQEALAKPDKAIAAATQAYSQFYTATVPEQAAQGTQTVISQQTQEYQTFYTATLPQIAATGQPLLFKALLGDEKTQTQAASELTSNLIKGMSASLTAWSGGKGSPLMNLLMGGSSPADAFKNWASGVAGVENAGGDVARGLRQAAGLDLPGPGGVGKGPKSNDTAFANDPAHYTANPVDPDSLNPLSAIARAAGRVSAALAGGAYADNALSATRPPDAMPLISGQSAAAQAAALTAQWRAKGFKGHYVFERGHLVWLPDTPPGRASGGPVEPGGTYLVGEQGPEFLHMGNQGGYITPNRGGGYQAGGNTYYITVQGFVGSEAQLAARIGELLAVHAPGRTGVR